MKKQIIFLLTFILIIGMSCSSYHIRRTDNPFTSTKMIMMRDNELGSYNIFTDDIICINACRSFQVENVTYYLVVNFNSTDRMLNIKKENSLMLIIDGKQKHFSVDQDNLFKHDAGYNGIHEEAWYKVDKTDLMKIAMADNVEMKLAGKKYYTEKFFYQKNIDRFKEFVSEYID